MVILYAKPEHCRMKVVQMIYIFAKSIFIKYPSMLPVQLDLTFKKPLFKRKFESLFLYHEIFQVLNVPVSYKFYKYQTLYKKVKVI